MLMKMQLQMFVHLWKHAGMDITCSPKTILIFRILFECDEFPDFSFHIT